MNLGHLDTIGTYHINGLPRVAWVLMMCKRVDCGHQWLALLQYKKVGNKLQAIDDLNKTCPDCGCESSLVQ